MANGKQWGWSWQQWRYAFIQIGLGGAMVLTIIVFIRVCEFAITARV